MRYLVLLLIFSFLVINCNRKAPSREFPVEVTTIKVDPTDNKSAPLSEVIESIKIIPLETKKECLVSDVAKLKISDNKIFILSGSIRNMRLLCFNLDGHFLFQIGNQGRGPGEYITLRDFNINKYYQRIELYDIYNDNILYFDFNGNYIGDYKLDRKARAYTIIDSLNYGIFNDAEIKGLPYNIFISPVNKFSVMFKGIPFRGEADIMNSINPFYSFKDNVLFAMSLNDTIYRVTPYGAIPNYLISFGNHPVIPDYIIEGGMFSIVDFVDNNNVPGFFSNLVESESYISLSYSYEKGFPNTFYYSKHTKDIINLYYPLNDINYLPIAAPFCSLNDCFVSIIQPYEIINKYRVINEQKMSDPGTVHLNAFAELQKIADNIVEEDNLLLLIYIIKPF